MEDMPPLGVGEVLVSTKTPLVGDTVHVNIPTVGFDLEYAWDIFIEENEIGVIKWNNENQISFVSEKSGDYKLKCYVRKRGGTKRTVRWSDFIHVK